MNKMHVYFCAYLKMSASYGSHQDWTPVVFNKATDISKPKPKKSKTSSTKTAPRITPSGIPAWQLESMADKGEDKMKLKTPSANLIKKIRDRRQELNLTQKEVANRANLQQSIIASYENGTAIVNQRQLSAIGRVLGITLSKKD